MRVFFSNLGCKLNQAELEALGREFAAAGYSIAPALEEADLHVVNTCTVTHAAARDSRKVARRGRRFNPQLKTVLTGCYATAEPREAAGLAGVDLVVTNRHKDALVERVREAFGEARPGGPEARYGNARALLKVEDGCNMSCSFCIIPITRGPQQSREADAIVRDVERLSNAGFHEVIVTGVQISSYRASTETGARGGLFELVSRLLDETAVGRLRLSSIAPWQFDRRLLGLFAGRGRGERLCRHFHLSLQSGCDATLERMRRPYTTSEFRSLLKEIRARDPHIAVTTDVIAGFPGETDREFEESLAFCASAGFARIHAFPYSSRPGTEAASLRPEVAPEVTRQRMKRLLETAAAAERRFLASQIGLEAEVLWETRRRGSWTGTTDNYVRTVCESAADLEGRAVRERLAAIRGNALVVEPRPTRRRGSSARPAKSIPQASGTEIHREAPAANPGSAAP